TVQSERAPANIKLPIGNEKIIQVGQVGVLDFGGEVKGGIFGHGVQIDAQDQTSAIGFREGPDRGGKFLALIHGIREVFGEDMSLLQRNIDQRRHRAVGIPYAAARNLESVDAQRHKIPK